MVFIVVTQQRVSGVSLVESLPSTAGPPPTSGEMIDRNRRTEKVSVPNALGHDGRGAPSVGKPPRNADKRKAHWNFACQRYLEALTDARLLDQATVQIEPASMLDPGYKKGDSAGREDFIEKKL